MTDAISARAGFIDPRIICPTSGEICPGRQHVVEQYDEYIDPAIAAGLPPENQPQLNQLKLNARLGEYTMRAQLIGCPGPDALSCPTRQNMDESQVRVGIVRTLRKIVRR